MQGCDVSFYTKDDGTKPAKEFISELEVKMKAKVYRLIDMLETNGQKLREPYSKHLDDGIFELRAKVGSDITRVLFSLSLGNAPYSLTGLSRKPTRRRHRKSRLQKSIATTI